MRFFKPKHQAIVLHRPGATVALAGRYLMVDARLSMKSKRDRKIALELVERITRELDYSQNGVRSDESSETGSTV